MQIKDLIQKYVLNYYTKEQISYRLPQGINLESFWHELVLYRKAKGELLSFKDQKGESFWFMLTPEIQQILYEIDTKGKDSLYQVVSGEIQSELVEEALIEEAMFSSVIEGAFSTLARARELAFGGARPRDKSDQMVLNNFQVMRFVLERKEDPCSVEFMHALQKIVTEKTTEHPSDSGAFRNDLVYIRNSQGEIVYTAPAAETVPRAMQDLIHWINDETKRPFIHPILSAIIIHTYFVYVHPYFDGNGRTARSLFYWYLLKHGYEFFRFFSISSIIQETRAQYYKALKNMEDCGADMTYVLLYMTGVTRRAIDVVIQRILERYRRETLFSVIERQKIPLNERQKKCLKAISVSKDKEINLAKYRRDFDVVYETARRDLAFLEKSGILKMNKKGRQFVYMLNPGFLRYTPHP